MLSEVKDIRNQKQEVQGNDAKPGKLLRCPQEGCGKVFRSSPGYRYHLKSHDLDPRPHVCSVCHKKFKSANGLKYHLRKAHHIEPVASKQNLNGATSPKGRESISSAEDDHFLNLNDNYARGGYMNGSFSSDRTPSIPSPLVKSPLGLSSSLVKNLPPIPSPLIKSPLGAGPYLSSSSSGSGLQSPYTSKDRYSQFYDKQQRNGEFSLRNGEFANRKYDEFCTRSSLSEYTQQCQQANNEFRQQCQRLSTGDLSNPRLPSLSDFPAQRSCDFYRRPGETFSHGGGASSPFGNFHNNNNNNNNKNSIDEPIYSSLNDVKLGSAGRDCRLFTNSYKDLIAPNEGSKYPEDLVNHVHGNNSSLSTSCSMMDNTLDKINGHLQDYHNNNNNNTLDCIPSIGSTSCSMQNNEQIVPDISSPGCQMSPPRFDRNNNNTATASVNNNSLSKNLRGASESSTETEFSDSVFQNENSNMAMSPLPASTSRSSPVLPSVSVKSEHVSNGEPVFPASSVESMLQSPKSLLVRRTSRSKSIPPALVINPSPTLENAESGKSKLDLCKKLDPASRLRHLAEIATSPRSPFTHSPLPLSLTPGLLASENTPDWNLKSPSKFSFPDKSFLLTPTVSRTLGLESSQSDMMTSSTAHSLPQSPFLDNIQTPSFWPSQMWPTPVWLCFLKGCVVKFEQDDKAFMTSEEVADFCTTPGGRKRDNMNFYTSGMKIVLIKEKTSVNSARDNVELMFEQIIPGTQRLVAKCPIDHPFYVKHKGWCASNPTEAMARYGAPFRKLSQNDIVIQSPNSCFVPTPGNTLSPRVKSTGAQVFTFNVPDTKLLKSESYSLKPERPTSLLPTTSTHIATSMTSAATTVKIEPSDASYGQPSSSSSSLETITLTFSSKTNGDASRQSSTQKLVNDFKSISEALKNKSKTNNNHGGHANEASLDLSKLSNGSSVFGNAGHVDSNSKKTGHDGHSNSTNTVRKKRRKPLAGNEEDRRPMNGFMLFAKSMRVELTKEFPGKDNRAISKLLGERWRELSEEKREDFSRMAKEMADERMKVNPDCWKRKHRKDRDGKPDGTDVVGVSDMKKPKLHLEKNDEFILPSATFLDAPNVMPPPDHLVSKPHAFLSTSTSTSASSPASSETMLSSMTSPSDVIHSPIMRDEQTIDSLSGLPIGANEHELCNVSRSDGVELTPPAASSTDLSIVKSETSLSGDETVLPPASETIQISAAS